MIIKSVLTRNTWRAIPRYFSEVSPSSRSTGASLAPAHDVPGLSSKCVATTSEPVGPGVDPKKTGAYKIPEYYCYNNMTYFEAEIEMSKFRCPQPSAVRK